MSRIVVTGGAGFLGWHVCRALLEGSGGAGVLILDRFTYAGSRAAVRELAGAFPGRVELVETDVRDDGPVRQAVAGAEAVIHMAAETHVDRSIRGARGFVETNVVGTQVVLDAAREAGVGRVVHTSTDEVYGEWPGGSDGGAGGTAPIPGPGFAETAPLRPRSPYAASKAAADHLCRAAWVTHALPVVVTRSCNAYGPGQYPEKLIPLAMRRIRAGQPVPLYGDGRQSREWVHAADQAAGIVAALRRGEPGRVYNLGGGERRTNADLVALLLDLMDAPPEGVEHVSDRPGHDRAYALDGTRARTALGWTPTRTLEGSLPDVVAWYDAHGEGWWG